MIGRCEPRVVSGLKPGGYRSLLGRLGNWVGRCVVGRGIRFALADPLPAEG